MYSLFSSGKSIEKPKKGCGGTPNASGAEPSEARGRRFHFFGVSIFEGSRLPRSGFNGGLAGSHGEEPRRVEGFLGNCLFCRVVDERSEC